MRAVFVDANPALRAIAEVVGPVASAVARDRLRRSRHRARCAARALAGAPIAVIDHTALPIEVARALRRACATSSSSAPARAATWIRRRSPAIGIAVHLIKGYGDTAVAECAIGLLFAAARGFAAMDRAMRDGRWLRSEGRQLAGKTLGLIGYGGIAAEVARIANGIGMRSSPGTGRRRRARPASSSSPSSGCSPRATRCRCICC